MEKQFQSFDFYETNLSFYHGNVIERFDLSDYGLTSGEICRYMELIRCQRDEAHVRYRIYENRCFFFKALSVFLCFCVFCVIVVCYDDFMRENDLYYDILLVPFRVGLVWLLYKYLYQWLSFVIENVRENVEKQKKYPDDGHPDGYNPRIEKYFDDILWELYRSNLTTHSV